MANLPKFMHHVFSDRKIIDLQTTSVQELTTLPALQVYKAKVRETGQSVAVKVQRPSVREAIALDIYIMRYLVGRFGILRKLNSDLPSLLDEWAGSLFRELDYRREARNGTKFQELYSHLEVSLSFFSASKVDAGFR